MSKRILTWEGKSLRVPLVTEIRVYGTDCNPKVLYAVIIADDNKFEGF